MDDERGNPREYIEDYPDSDVERVEQLYCLLYQFRTLTRLEILVLDFGAFLGMHVAGSEALWNSLIRAFAQLTPLDVLKKLHLEYRMLMNGQAIGINICVSQ